MALAKLPEEAYAVLDRLDEAMISSELAGLLEYGAQELIYSFKIDGRDVTGLSWKGAKALARWMAEKGHPLDAAEKDITQDEDTWFADVKIVDKSTGLGLWGTSKAKKMKEIHVVDGARNWVKNPDGSWKYFEKPDEHSRTIALNKAQRNAICAHVPDKMIAQFIKKATSDGRARQVSPDEVESYRQRKQVDSEEVTRIREQALRDREERLARPEEGIEVKTLEELEEPEEPEARRRRLGLKAKEPEEPEPEEEEPVEPDVVDGVNDPVAEEKPPEGPPRSVQDVKERLSDHIVGLDEWIVISERPDFIRVGKHKRLEDEMEYTVDELVERMGGTWDKEANCWKIPRG